MRIFKLLDESALFELLFLRPFVITFSLQSMVY